jgi:glycosyltransferase involved in cell wall biosynthesis
MNVVVSCDHHFERTPDGRVWTNGTCAYSLWTRYIECFDKARVVARIKDVPELIGPRKAADGPRVEFHAVPDFVGPQQYLTRMPVIARATAQAIEKGDAVFLRAPGLTTSWLNRTLKRTGRPFGVEVVTDPYDVFAPGAFRHPARPFFRWWVSRGLRRLCARACGATYVTEHALQRRYPPGPGAYATYYSDVELDPAAYVETPRTKPPGGAVRLIYVGTLAQLYKAPEVLVDAVGACVREQVNVELVLIGSGKYQDELAQRARGHGLNGRVQFRGHLAGAEPVRSELDRADIFVLPSRQEGLPRAMVEAMARALPCIGSTVGGIPELLPAEDLVPPGDASALARKIREVATDPARLARMSAHSLTKAREYAPDVLATRRNALYQHVRAETTAWLKRQ